MQQPSLTGNPGFRSCCHLKYSQVCPAIDNNNNREHVLNQLRLHSGPDKSDQMINTQVQWFLNQSECPVLKTFLSVMSSSLATSTTDLSFQLPHQLQVTMLTQWSGVGRTALTRTRLQRVPLSTHAALSNTNQFITQFSNLCPSLFSLPTSDKFSLFVVILFFVLGGGPIRWVIMPCFIE